MKMLLNRAAVACVQPPLTSKNFFEVRGGCTQARQRARVDVFKKVVPREFTCNIILDYERDKLHSFDSNSFSK